jgi:uncharacterized SAM-binding protein YcdF (DUF218 family)
LIVIGVAFVWLSQCEGAGLWLQDRFMPASPPLSSAQRAELASAAQRGEVAVVVLGMGLNTDVGEYDGGLDLPPDAMHRWRYGVWLAGELHAPLLFAGGIGHASAATVTEAQGVAAASRRLGLPQPDAAEGRSTDTAGNARETLALLNRSAQWSGVRQLVVVTHQWHMPRAVRAFRRATAMHPRPMTVVPAPMAVYRPSRQPWLLWMPSPDGHTLVTRIVRERLGWWMSA